MKCKIKIKDKINSIYEIDSANLSLNGIMIGKKTANWTGCQILKDLKNKLYAKTFFNYS